LFKNKGVKIVEKQILVGFKSFNSYGDANMAITRNNVPEEHVFKDRKPIKNKSVVD
jgi:hypothetical protein